MYSDFIFSLNATVPVFLMMVFGWCVRQLGLLDERERQIIVLRYGLSDSPPIAQREVAERLGISRSYVSRLEKKALETLRREME